MPGCIFEYYGRIPAYVYSPNSFNSPLEAAVFDDDVERFRSLVKVRAFFKRIDDVIPPACGELSWLNLFNLEFFRYRKKFFITLRDSGCLIGYVD